VDNGANLLIPVPGSGDGPGGVLVCAENFLLYRHQVRGCGAGGGRGASFSTCRGSSSSSSRQRAASSSMFHLQTVTIAQG
jgi:splicing factor 3B subunit 3